MQTFLNVCNAEEQHTECIFLLCYFALVCFLWVFFFSMKIEMNAKMQPNQQSYQYLYINNNRDDKMEKLLGRK